MGIRNIEINPDWYYHRVTADTIDKIILSGSIKPRILTDKNNIIRYETTWNGQFYISLSKNLSEIYYNSSYKNFIDGQYAFVIDNIDAIKCVHIDNESELYKIISKLPIKKRYSCWKDEYQVKGEIPFDKIVGIKLPNKKSFWSRDCIGYLEEDLGITAFLEKFNAVDVDLSFIDLEEGKIIDKDQIKEYILMCKSNNKA